jgi:hypothetical protein
MTRVGWKRDGCIGDLSCADGGDDRACMPEQVYADYEGQVPASWLSHSEFISAGRSGQIVAIQLWPCEHDDAWNWHKALTHLSLISTQRLSGMELIGAANCSAPAINLQARACEHLGHSGLGQLGVTGFLLTI